MRGSPYISIMPPGSPQAVQAGCSCPVEDNEHGAGCAIMDGMPVYWINSECHIHGPDGNAVSLNAGIQQ